jgi:apolipoprotein N-acyltransferase
MQLSSEINAELATMSSARSNTFPVKDRWSSLWLLLGGVLGLFANWQWTIPVAPWLSILFFIRFMHCQKPVRGYVILNLVAMVQTAVVNLWQELIPESLLSVQMRFAMLGMWILWANVPYLADRLIAPRFTGATATLVAPLAFTAWEFMTLAYNPMGSWGSLAYSQYGNLPLMQLVSLTGLWGLTFLITWFGATVNWAWEQSFAWPAVRRSVALYGAVMALVLFYGAARLVFHDSPAGTMRIASFTSVELRDEQAGLKTAFRETTRDFQRRYFDETRRQADAGAQLILWPEAAGVCANEDEAALIEQGRKIAREKGIYLAMPLLTRPSNRSDPAENKLIVIDPAGELVMEHYKFSGRPLEDSVRGDGVLQTFQTPSAIVSGVICSDMDVPRIVSQSGRNGTAILLAPANDWEAVSTTHAHMAVFRAIENGVSLVRQASHGLSIATDPYGRTLATMDHFTANERLMVAQVPITGVTTMYSIVGDLFGWSALIGFLLFVCRTVVRGRHSKRT